MDKRYQVFVSSTYTDLKEERKAIIETLLNAKYIPAGMEMFSASNDDQFKYIKKIIDTCDYYILILGARYGSVNSTTGISFTEQEYDYAVSRGIPVLVFLHDNPYNLPAEKRDDDKKDLLEAFRAKVSQNRLCRVWNNMSTLVTSVIISLTEETSENPQLGWVRGSTFDATELLLQVNELRLEKEELQKVILKLKATIMENSYKVENLASGSERYIIKGQKYDSSRYSESGYVHYKTELKWDEIFSAVAPYLFTSKNYDEFEHDLRIGINTAYDIDFSILNDDCVQTIKIQLNALGLIDVNSGESTRGVVEFITLTQKGKDYLLYIKSIKTKVEW
jgi:hypothetical protein